jgi:starch-binding outer membrane protein, SusD/RagB family
MTTTHTQSAGRLLVAAAMLAAVGCDEFVTVDNPNVIDINVVDPVKDAATLANSAQQNFAAALGWSIMYSSWYNGESIVAETFPTRNEFGRRAVTSSNGSLSTDVWQTLSLSAASTKIVLDLELPTPTTNINYARVALWRGYTFQLIAENFCSGAISGGAELSTAQLLDSATFYFTSAITIGNANGSADARALANTALVGRARANLQAGRRTQAAADAAAVPAGFSFSLNYIDDLANRNRLGNRFWQFTLDRGSIGVPAGFRVRPDPRVKYKDPTLREHTLTPQDPSTGEFFIQDKYPSFTSPVRVASKLEADYIAAEVAGTAAQLTHLNARRSANSLPAYSGATDAASVLTEFLWQKSLDFYLEGQRMGDFRRNPSNIRFLPVPGAAYFKPGFPAIGNGTCYPLPLTETANNPNFPKS